MKRSVKTVFGALLGLGLAAIVLWLTLSGRLAAAPTVFRSVVNEENIEQLLRGQNYGIGLFLLAVLQMGQVVSVVIPAAPIQIAGGLVYGTPVALVLCHLSFVGANLAIFNLAANPRSPFGRRAAHPSPAAQKLTEWIRGNEPGLMTLMAYMMPGLPNGLVPYAAARLGLPRRTFFWAVYGGSLLPIFLMCLLGSQILSGNILASVLMCGVLVVCIALLYLFKKPLLALLHRPQK